jgi:hypothetical protein
MGMHMFQDHTDRCRPGKVALDQGFHTLGKIASRATAGHLDMPPAGQRLEKEQQVTGPLAPILVVVAGGSSRGHRPWLLHLAHQLVGRRIKAHVEIASVIRLGIQGQDVFHAPDECGADRRYTPLFPAPGIQRMFLRVRRTVSSEMASMTRSATSVLASGDDMVSCPGLRLQQHVGADQLAG